MIIGINSPHLASKVGGLYTKHLNHLCFVVILTKKKNWLCIYGENYEMDMCGKDVNIIESIDRFDNKKNNHSLYGCF